MSQSLSTVAAEIYDSAVKSAYADTAKLTETIYTKSSKHSNAIKFRKIGKGLATQVTTPSADVVPMGVTHALVNCPLTNWRAAEYTDLFSNADVNFSEVNELATIIAQSLGRRSDQLVIDALAATTTTAVGDKDTALNLDTILAAKKELDKNGVPSENRYFILESKGMEDLLKTTQITSSDYNTVKALVAGDVNTFAGFKFIQIADREEGGIVYNSTDNDFTGYAYHMRAVGFGKNLNIKTGSEWIAHKQSWLSVGNLKAGSVLIDSEGVVPVIYKA